MSCQREARGSLDGAGEGESGKGGAAEVEVRSVESTRYLVSFVVRCCWFSFLMGFGEMCRRSQGKSE